MSSFSMMIPTESVGSLPRPAKLQAAYADYDSGKISLAQLERYQDDACKEAVELMENTGQWCVTDGENRSSSFATYPFVDTIQGSGLSDCLAPGGQYFAIFDDGHHRQLPRLVKGPFKYKTYAADYFRKSKRFATKPMKQAVISPSCLYLLYPLDEDIDGYTRDEFAKDLVDECEKDIRKCFQSGASRVSIDFTEGRLACRNDPKNPWTGRKMLDTFIDLNNSVLNRFTVEERKNIGIHTCPGGDCDSTHSLDVDYTELLPSIFKMNAGYFLIQVSTEIDKPRIYELIAKHSRDDVNGVPQVCFIGVINTLSPRVETPEEVADALVEAAKYIPVARLGSTDDCGFSPFSIDDKPKHQGPDEARRIAFLKIEARVKGTQLASQRLNRLSREG